jgi:hypothetical protein
MGHYRLVSGGPQIRQAHDPAKQVMARAHHARRHLQPIDVPRRRRKPSPLLPRLFVDGGVGWFDVVKHDGSG